MWLLRSIALLLAISSLSGCGGVTLYYGSSRPCRLQIPADQDCQAYEHRIPASHR